MRKLLSVFVFMVFNVMIGCASDYTCGSVPGSKCKNVDQVYESTNTGVKDYRSSLYDGDPGNNSKNKTTKVELSASSVTLEQVKTGDPILTNPAILRILIASWEDADKDLHAGGYIYIRLKDPEWRM